ncbi:MAG: hypothetical protein ACI8WB_004082, partial [Phenylobacterium sp.]
MKTVGFWLKMCCSVFSAIMLSSCQLLSATGDYSVTCDQNGYSEWYDYYWKGLACMDVNRWTEAKVALSMALHKRDNDKRRVY